MNSFSSIGYIIRDAESSLIIDDNGIEKPLVSFPFMDKGTPYQKSEPMFIDVHFMKDAAMNIFPYLKKDREVTIFGCLRCKSYTTKNGEKKQKYFISADYVMLNNVTSAYRKNIWKSNLNLILIQSLFQI